MWQTKQIVLVSVELATAAVQTREAPTPATSYHQGYKDHNHGKHSHTQTYGQVASRESAGRKKKGDAQSITFSIER